MVYYNVGDYFTKCQEQKEKLRFFSRCIHWATSTSVYRLKTSPLGSITKGEFINSAPSPLEYFIELGCLIRKLSPPHSQVLHNSFLSGCSEARAHALHESLQLSSHVLGQLSQNRAGYLGLKDMQTLGFTLDTI